MVILIGILSSINILKDKRSISLIVRDGLWLSVLMTIPSFILFWNLSPIFLYLGQNQTVVELTQAYLRPLAWGLLPNLVMFALFEFIVG